MSIARSKEILYKRDKSGKVVSYQIFVKYPKSPSAGIILVKLTGKLDGKKVENRKVFEKGKNIGRANETSALEQAVSEMESAWKKKQDEGYRTAASVGVTIEIDPNNASNANFYKFGDLRGRLQDLLHEALPMENTDSNGLQKPMLAHTYKEGKVKLPGFLQPKLDGVRALGIIGQGGTSLLSRKGKYYSVPHILNDLRKAMSLLSEDGELILDGEIYNHNMEFEEISSAVKSVKAETFKLNFMVYDVVVKGLPFKDRLALLTKVFDEAHFEHIKLVKTFSTGKEAALKKFHDVAVNQGYEGAMYRSAEGMYEGGFRSHDLLKIKIFDDTEYEFVKFDTSGHRGIQDIKAVCKYGDKGKTFEAPMNGTLAHKESLYQQFLDGEIKPGQLVTVEHFGLTAYGAPRFPKGKAFRDYE